MGPLDDITFLSWLGIPFTVILSTTVRQVTELGRLGVQVHLYIPAISWIRERLGTVDGIKLVMGSKTQSLRLPLLDD